jgi:galactokinase
VQAYISETNLEWSNYFKAGYLGHLQFPSPHNHNPQFKSLQILIDGTVPTGSGLSSSAAFVVSSLISSILASLSGISKQTTSPNSRTAPTGTPVTTSYPRLSKHAIVSNAMISERAVGVNSGGMDQAASVFGLPSRAVYIQFYPHLSASTVSFPGHPPPCPLSLSLPPFLHLPPPFSSPTLPPPPP